MRTVLLYLYTIYVYLILFPFTFVNVLIILFFNMIGFKKTSRFFITFWAKGCFVLIGKKFSVKGQEHIVKDKNHLLLANHSSLFDIMAIMAIDPTIAWFGRAHLLKIPIFGTVLKSINYIPMKSTDVRNTKLMINQLIETTKDKSVAIFPEGTRTLNGEANKFRKGFIHVLKASQLDVVPISLNGLYSLKPKNRFYYDYSAEISAIIHPPIYNKDIATLNDNEIINIMQTQIIRFN